MLSLFRSDLLSSVE